MPPSPLFLRHCAGGGGKAENGFRSNDLYSMKARSFKGHPPVHMLHPLANPEKCMLPEWISMIVSML